MATPLPFRSANRPGTPPLRRIALSAAALLVPLAGAMSCSGAGDDARGAGGVGAAIGGGGGTSSGGSGAGGASTDGAGGLPTGGSSAGGSSSSGGTDAGRGAAGGAQNAGGSAGSGGVTGAGGDASSGGAAAGGSSAGGSGGSDSNPLSPGCGKTPPTRPPKNQQQTAEILGDTRYYLMDVPASADSETPLMLVFGLHGYDMNNIAVVNLFNFTERSGGRAITVWPQGEGPHPGDVSHWGDNVLKSTWTPNEKNYTFIEQLITDLGERYCIDRRQIFIAGFSMGGFFTNQMACDHSDWFRAFAPVAGGGPQACANSAVQSAIMVQHGTADPVVELSSGEGSRDFWRDQNDCNSSSTSSLNNCAFYEGCADEKPVAWCTGNYDHYIPNEAASNIWSFFDSF